ncbi:DsbA family protein [Chelativorans sp. Marseille-P2723]|uniref:DsbA family protein n=1 Tax=Chelativorans sp. Marseille-P2723 TaxID=2709133 RepID=UPI001FEF4693|nr:DsbA family protein [Chelativorans sp. Marseille-P2723]
MGPANLAAEEHNEGKPLSRSQVEGIVRDYLLANPEILMEMQTALESRMREQQLQATRQAITESAGEIFNSVHDGVIGNPEGDITVVEFFDYNCGFCKRALSDMEELVANDSNLRFVLKEFPILGPDSQQAHVVSMAFRNLMPEKYAEFHRRLLSANGRATEATAINLALELGIDESALRAEMQNPQIQRIIAQTYELADRLQITGTPSYVVGNEVIFGAMGRDVLSEKIAVARQ